MKTDKVSLSLKRLFIRGRSPGLRPFKKVPSPLKEREIEGMKLIKILTPELTQDVWFSEWKELKNR